jgi:hypothetical protein
MYDGAWLPAPATWWRVGLKSRCQFVARCSVTRSPCPIRWGSCKYALATNDAIDLPGLPQIPAPVTDQSCAATSSANTLIGVGYPHTPPSCLNLHSARRSRRHRLPFPAGSFIEGVRTPATVQAASLRSAGIRNPQQHRTKTGSPNHQQASFWSRAKHHGCTIAGIGTRTGISDLRKINSESGRLCGGSVCPIIPSAFYRP